MEVGEGGHTAQEGGGVREEEGREGGGKGEGALDALLPRETLQALEAWADVHTLNPNRPCA